MNADTTIRMDAAVYHAVLGVLCFKYIVGEGIEAELEKNKFNTTAYKFFKNIQKSLKL